MHLDYANTGMYFNQKLRNKYKMEYSEVIDDVRIAHYWIVCKKNVTNPMIDLNNCIACLCNRIEKYTADVSLVATISFSAN